MFILYNQKRIKSKQNDVFALWFVYGLKGGGYGGKFNLMLNFTYLILIRREIQT